MRRLPGGIGRAILGVSISIVALALVVRSVDLAAAWETLKGADARWVALLVAFVGADVLLRALRWRVLLAPVGRVSFGTTLSSLLVGYLANNILPARLGEIVRSVDLGERTRLSRSTILGTIVVERVVDTVVVVAIASVAILVLSVRGIVASAVLVGLALTALLVVAIAAGIAAHRLPGGERFATYLHRWPRVRVVLVRLREGLSIATDVRTMAGAVALSVASWSCTVVAFAAAAQAVGVQPTMGQAALLAAGTNLATAIPAAPGYVGTFELAAVTIGASVGIVREDTLAFAILLHVSTLLITSVGGAIAFALGQRSRARRAPVSVGDNGRTTDPAVADAVPSPAADEVVARSKGA
ncbi:MAG TPA: lysylphosphatidylglycerol synthase transmembrane domain-containing protein [Candidatus Limnocylindrales bacterium]